MRNDAAVPRRGLDRELAGHEREQIGRQRLRLGELDGRPGAGALPRHSSTSVLAVGHRLPAAGTSQRQRDSALSGRADRSRGTRSWARAGTNSVYRKSSLRFSASSPATNSHLDLVLARARLARGMTRCPRSTEKPISLPCTRTDCTSVARLLEVEDERCGVVEPERAIVARAGHRRLAVLPGS